MGRHKTPVEVDRVNGNPSRKKLPEISLEGSHLPVGDAPKGMAADEKAVWKRLSNELPFLNMTNRYRLELAVHAAFRYDRLRKFFDRRRAEMKRNKLPEVYAELNDECTRPHPLLGTFRDARDQFRGSLAELGGTPSVQARLLEFIDSSMRKRAKAQREQDGFYT